MSKKISRLISLGMILFAVGFLLFAFGHPELFFPWSNTITYILYLIYIATTVFLLIAPFHIRAKNQD